MKSRKILGIIIDNKLTSKWHIDHTSGKISRGIEIVINNSKVIFEQICLNATKLFFDLPISYFL